MLSLFMFSSACLEISVFTERCLDKTSVKMANMWVVKLSYCVTPQFIISVTADKKKLPDWNMKICCNKDQKLTNTVINKKCLLWILTFCC